MMQFRLLKAAMVQLLGDNANGEFRVFGYQTQTAGADEFINKNRAVRVFYEKGKFPSSSNSAMGKMDHHVTMMIEFIATAKAQTDVSVLQNPESTPAEIQAALIATKDAANVADDLVDELVDIVWQILMSAENIDLGMPDFTLGKMRSVEAIEKDPPSTNGEYVILTGAMPLTTSVSEEITGETPIPAEQPGAISTDINKINEDSTQETGWESE